MLNFAVVENNVVINVIVADSIEDAVNATGLTCIEYTQENPAAIGWTYNGTTLEGPVIPGRIPDQIPVPE